MNQHDHDHDHPVDHDAEPTGEGTDAANPAASTGARPLGFWLKAVDGLIDREFETAFADLGVTRRDWRLLNLIGGEVRDDRLRGKLDARPHRLLPLVERGWVTGEPGAWALTDEGRDALATLGERVNGIRSRIGGAVSSDDYATTVASLEAIARELGWNEADADAWRRAGRSGRGPWGMRPGPGFRRFGRPPFGPGPGPDAEHPHAPMPGRECEHGHGHGHASHGRTGRDGELHVHVHLDDPRGRRRGHRGHHGQREHAGR